MSRIGDRILTVPENVTVNVNNDVVSVKGPKGELSTEIAKGLSVTVQDGNLTVSRKNDAIKKINKINKDRAKHYKFYTNREWKSLDNYDLLVNVDKYGIEDCNKFLESYLKKGK